MDSIDKGATIRIGLRNYYRKIDNVSSDFKVPTYSLKINKKTILNSTCTGSSKDYLIYYEKAAKKIAKLMNENNVKDYVIYNGERIKFSNNKWESCDNIPNDSEQIFKKTLEHYLD